MKPFYTACCSLVILASSAHAGDSPVAIQGEIAKLHQEKFELEKQYVETQKAMDLAFEELEALNTQEKDLLINIQDTREDLQKTARLLAHLTGSNPLRLLAEPEENKRVALRSVLAQRFSKSLTQKNGDLNHHKDRFAAFREEKEDFLLNLQDMEEKMAARFEEIEVLKQEKLAMWRKLSDSRSGPGPKVISVKPLNDTPITKDDVNNALKGAVVHKKDLGDKDPNLHVTLKTPVKSEDKLTFAPFDHPEIKGSGVVMETKRGQTVVSPTQGRVMYVGNIKNTATKTIIIEHADKTQSLLMGVDRALLGHGQTVYAGQSIATMPSYGKEPPKLFWEFRHQNKPISPLPYLQDTTRGQNAH